MPPRLPAINNIFTGARARVLAQCVHKVGSYMAAGDEAQTLWTRAERKERERPTAGVHGELGIPISGDAAADATVCVI